MCRRLESSKESIYHNKLSGGRCALCCIGLLFVIVIGAAAGALAYYLPDIFSEEGRYKAIFNKFPNDNAIILSNSSCSNYASLVANFEDKLVLKCRGGSGVERETCIPIELYCDGYYDCDDKSDEENCAGFCKDAQKSINDLRFSCPTSNRQAVNFTDGPQEPECFSTSYYCDGWVECLQDDEFDEKFPNCPLDTFKFPHPEGREAQCSDDNGFLCRDRLYCTSGQCNGYSDCSDGSDELYCA